MTNGPDQYKCVALANAVDFLSSSEPVADDLIVEQAQQVIFCAVLFEAYLRGESKGKPPDESS
jgi:hypothetical protein